MRSLHLLNRRLSGLLVVDLQERLMPAIPNQAKIVWNARRLIQAAKLLDVETTSTVQYPQGLGSTVSTLASLLPAPIEKRQFSAVVPELTAWRSQHEFVQIVLCGIETHVCVLQTAMDLLAAGVDVYLPVDAIGSRSELDHRIAVDRLQACGATLTTVEAVLFEWCETSTDPNFKAISQLVKEEFTG